ncbi:MAG: hypothetical protein WBQ02_05155 [Terracidiphilus sp.]
MNLGRRFFSLAVLSLVSLLTCNGCKSGTNQAATQPASGSGNAAQPNSQPTAAGQPGAQASAPQGEPGAAQNGQAAPPPQGPPPPTVVELPAGTRLHVRLDQDLGSKVSHPGDSFGATVAEDVIVNGQTVVPKHARAEGTVIDAKPLGHFKGGAALELRLERVHTNWGSYPVATSTIERAEKGKGKRTAAFAGGGGAFGAIIGGIAGGGKGALIGGLAGAGAGTAGSAFTGNHEIFLPAETLLTFRLEHSVHITESQ